MEEMEINIFFLSYCPKKSAIYQIDRHVVKMPSESAIMLANAYSLDELEVAPKTKMGNVRGHGYPHHGCTKWAINNLSNFNWLLEHALYLCNEYECRFDKTHFCKGFFLWCQKNQPKLDDSIMISKPFLAMPEKYKVDSPVDSYRDYYVNDKRFDKNGTPMFKWTKREIPSWIYEKNCIAPLSSLS